MNDDKKKQEMRNALEEVKDIEEKTFKVKHWKLNQIIDDSQCRNNSQ